MENFAPGYYPGHGSANFCIDEPSQATSLGFFERQLFSIRDGFLEVFLEEENDAILSLAVTHQPVSPGSAMAKARATTA